MSSRFTSAGVLGVALTIAVFAVAALPTLFLWSLGGYNSRQLFSSTSPDGQYRIEGVMRADFPANDMLDPSGTLRITLSEAGTGSVLDQLFIGLFEMDDFREPTVTWQPDGRVHLQDLERNGHRVSATLDVRAFRAR